MASQVPPKRGVAFSFEISLVSQADTDIFQSNPTLAAGDVVIYQDGALDGNIDSLPTAIGAGKTLAVTLSIAEMTADRVAVAFSDQAGDEWQDLIVSVHTVTTSQIDDLATATDLPTVQTDLNNPAQYKADVSALATSAALTAVGSNVDTILSDTGTDGVAIADGYITAAKIAPDAITSSELAASAVQEIADQVWDEAQADHVAAGSTGESLSNAGGGSSPATIADAVWDEAKAGHVDPGSFGEEVQAHALTSDVASLASNVWTREPRTLTQSAATAADVVDGTLITEQRFTTWSITIVDLGDISSRTALYFTVKDQFDRADSAALFQVEETEGLLYLDGSAADDSADGTLIVNDQVTGSITITATTNATTWAAGIYVYDVKMLTASAATPLTVGTFKLVNVVTRTVT